MQRGGFDVLRACSARLYCLTNLLKNISSTNHHSSHWVHRHGEGSSVTSSLRSSMPAFSTLVQSCFSDSRLLKSFHALFLVTGVSVKDRLVAPSLRQGNTSCAHQLLAETRKPGAFGWNVLLKGYVKNNSPSDASSVYRHMHLVGVGPDPYTFPFVIKACTKLAKLWDGVAVHGQLSKFGLDHVPVVRTELMVMYVRAGELGSADCLFDSMVYQDLVAWNALISACVQNGYAAKSVALFGRMVNDGPKPDSVTVVSVISACGHLGCLQIGEKVYDSARTNGIVCNIIVENARLDMYAKCGNMGLASDIFHGMPCRNVISWSTMIGGYAVNGESERALALFSAMQEKGLKPNHVTLLGVLCACSHAGLVSEGWDYFNYMAMSKFKDLQPRKEHYACMVDLLGRAGQVGEAYQFIKRMPVEPDPGIWGALLGACAIHRNVELGQHVAESLFTLTPDIAAYNVLLSNIYAAAGRWDCVDKVRLAMRRRGVKKVGAYSSTEIDGNIHVLYWGDRSHPQTDSIYKKLDELITQMKCMGYIQKTGSVFHDVEVEEREAAVSAHSEKIIIALALISGLKHEFPIRVMKNLRICDDCHTFSKFVSKMTMREIIMRDKIRFHHFRDGVCSCKDYW